MTEGITLSHALYQDMVRDVNAMSLGDTRNPFVTVNNYMGMDAYSNSMFPFPISCSTCGSTGEGGDEATYCPKCHGAGEIRVDGMMQSGRQTPVLLTGVLPPKFAPYFPRDIHIPFPISKGPI